MIPPILARRSAAGFWLAVLLTGAGTGIAAAALTGLLELVQHLVWGGGGLDLLQAASHAMPWRHLVALLGAGLLTGAGHLLLTHLSSANGIDITTAIWFHVMELTGYARAAIVPMLVAVATATLIARTVEPRSIYDARLSDTQVRERQRARDHAPDELPPG